MTLQIHYPGVTEQAGHRLTIMFQCVKPFQRLDSSWLLIRFNHRFRFQVCHRFNRTVNSLVPMCSTLATRAIEEFVLARTVWFLMSVFNTLQYPSKYRCLTDCSPYLCRRVWVCHLCFYIYPCPSFLCHHNGARSQHPSAQDLENSLQQPPLCVVPSTPFQRASSHRATVAHGSISLFPPALAHAGVSELPLEIEKSTRPPTPLPVVAHLQFCCTLASHSPSPSYAARTVPWFRNPIQEFHSTTPNTLFSFLAGTIHAVVSTLPDHCDQAVVERLPMLVPHTDE